MDLYLQLLKDTVFRFYPSKFYFLTLQISIKYNVSTQKKKWKQNRMSSQELQQSFLKSQNDGCSWYKLSSNHATKASNGRAYLYEEDSRL